MRRRTCRREEEKDETKDETEDENDCGGVEHNDPVVDEPAPEDGSDNHARGPAGGNLATTATG